MDGPITWTHASIAKRGRLLGTSRTDRAQGADALHAEGTGPSVPFDESAGQWVG
jgi:hypothetical protein